MGDKKSGPLYNYNSFSSYNVKAGGSKNSPKGFSMRSGNNPSVSELSGISPIKQGNMPEIIQKDIKSNMPEIIQKDIKSKMPLINPKSPKGKHTYTLTKTETRVNK